MMDLEYTGDRPYLSIRLNNVPALLPFYCPSLMYHKRYPASWGALGGLGYRCEDNTRYSAEGGIGWDEEIDICKLVSSDGAFVVNSKERGKGARNPGRSVVGSALVLQDRRSHGQHGPRYP